MLKHICFCLVTISALSFCAKKTGGESDEDRQTRLESAQAKTAQKLAAQGQPSPTWSHDQLNQFERQLDHLEQIDSELHGRGVTSANSSYYTSMRKQLGQARASKLKKGQTASLAPSNL